MKKQRFIITEIYNQDMHAANKVLVDTQTRVQYLLHQEGTSSALVCLVDETGQPLLSDTLDSIEMEQLEKIDEVDTINERKHDEILQTFPRVEVK